MHSLEEIESAISQLSVDDLANFRKWFDKFDAEQWDKQFETDVHSGKLDKLGEEAIKEFRSGKYKEL